MFAIEYELMPDLDNKISSIATALKIKYLNFKTLENTYQYVDGNHLYKPSGEQVSAVIAVWMVQNP